MSLDNLSGQMLGQYELRELLGVGGMGAVYRAYQSSLKREVAVKVLPPSLAAQPGYAERFIREAETAAALEHPHIVPIVDYDTANGISYIVMRLLTGGTLAERLAQRSGRLPSLGEISELLRQMASALDYAHSQGVIHRDLKLTNVMFDSQGNAYLVDFGIAKLLGGAGLTSTGMALGTPSYMAPEQWRGEEVTPAADLYALGVMTYQLVTGRAPFEAPTPYALMHKHLHEEATPPQALRAGLPEAVTPVLQRAMAKEAHERFATAAAYAQAFDEVIRGKRGETTQFLTFAMASTPPRLSTPQYSATAPTRIEATGPASTVEIVRRNPQIALVAFAMLILIVAVGAFLLGQRNPEEEVAALATHTSLPQTTIPTALAVIEQTAPLTSPAIAVSETPQSTATEIPIIMDAPATFTAVPLVLPTSAAEEVLPPTIPPLVEAVPTVLHPDGRRVQLFWNSTSFYWHNPTGNSVRVSPLDFEALDEFGNPIAYFFDGIRWTLGFNAVEPGRCVAIELLQTSNWLRPSQCRGYNSTLTLQQSSNEVFWVAGGGASQFRVLWEGQEVGRCPLSTQFCEVRIPPQ